jgi:glycogen synthase
MREHRILYALGPEDIFESYSSWKDDKNESTQMSETFSGQLFEVCEILNAKAYVISQKSPRRHLLEPKLELEQRPNRFSSARGLKWHLGYFLYGLSIIASAIRFRATEVVVATGTTYWFLLSILCFLGIKVIPDLHCTLWRKHSPPTVKEKFFLNLDRYFFKYFCHAIMVVSEEIQNQIVELTETCNKPILNFIPSFDLAGFEAIAPPDHSKSIFRILFVGRLEEDKGALYLPRIADRLRKEIGEIFHFDICGEGSASEILEEEVFTLKLQNVITLHGYLRRNELLDQYSASNVVIVPTTSRFSEGFNRVVAEGVLARRPVVASAACPAISYFSSAVVSVPPDDIDAYTSSIITLKEDSTIYQNIVDACDECRPLFENSHLTWKYTLQSALQINK